MVALRGDRLRRVYLIVAVAAFAFTIAGLFGPGSAAGAGSATRDACRLGAANTLAAVECARIPAVPSLEPAATIKLWRTLVHARRTQALTAATDCRPLRAIFYTASDWNRLATKLAANGSPCAQYYISIPPLSADKTQPRTNQAGQIRALGPNFHAMAEIHMATWGTWVTDTGGTWYQAGVEARRRMQAAGYFVAQGDTWAVNEASSAVRRGDGTARADLRELVRGLFDGDGTLPTARGTVFIIGLGQGTPDLSTYKTTLKNWLQDTAFWADMNAYVSDWAQEVYGDFRNHGVAGSSLPNQRDYLNDYLQHFTVLAGVGPDTIATARSYLQQAYSPLANAAWQYDSGFGFTLISADQMKHFVSAQTYALRYFSGTNSQALEDRGGFAWKPNNATAIPSSDFTTQSGEILDRLGSAIRDSGQPLDPSDPGIGACGPLGQNLWCAGEIAGASFNEAWKTFRFWQPTLAFATAPQTLTAGIPSGPIAVQLQTSAGAAESASSPVTVSLTSSSAQGAFSASASAPWTSTLSVTIAAGSSTSGSFYYLDTKAGSPTLTASATDATSGTQTETVNPAPLASVTVSPSSVSVVLGGAQAFTANGADAYGNLVTVASASWSVSAGTPGTVSPTTGNPTTFTASSTTTGSGSVIATVEAATGSLTGSASVTVVAPTVSVSSITYGTQKQHLLVTAALVENTGKPVSGASVSISLYRDGSLYRSATGTTGTEGKLNFKATNAPSGCYTTSVTNVAASGFSWDGVTPANQFRKYPIPAQSVKRIVSEYGNLAYLPAWAPRGFIFTSWRIEQPAFNYLMERLGVTFRRRGTRLVWTVSDGRDRDDFADCSRRPFYDFKRRIGNRVVYYAHGNQGDSAWTCLRVAAGSGYRQPIGIDLWIENSRGRPSQLTAMRMVASARRP